VGLADVLASPERLREEAFKLAAEIAEGALLLSSQPGQPCDAGLPML